MANVALAKIYVHIAKSERPISNWKYYEKRYIHFIESKFRYRGNFGVLLNQGGSFMSEHNFTKTL